MFFYSIKMNPGKMVPGKMIPGKMVPEKNGPREKWSSEKWSPGKMAPGKNGPWKIDPREKWSPKPQMENWSPRGGGGEIFFFLNLKFIDYTQFYSAKLFLHTHKVIKKIINLLGPPNLHLRGG